MLLKPQIKPPIARLRKFYLFPTPLKTIDFTGVSSVFLFIIFFFLQVLPIGEDLGGACFSQSVGIFGSTNLSVNNTGTKANVKAVFDISSPDKGLLIPRITTASRDTFTNIPTSLLIFNTTTNQYEYFLAGTWKGIAATGTNWSLTGNSATIDGTNFIGTTDAIPFNIRVNNLKAGRIEHNDGVNFGANTFFGFQAGNSNAVNFGLGDGLYNTALGYQALYLNTTGSYNVANGSFALYSNTTGYYNTASGIQALNSNNTGSSNTANGYTALFSNTTGNDNIANGYEALYSNTTGSANTASGNYVLYSNTTGEYNTANGHSALFSNDAGSYATAIGVNAMYYTNNQPGPFTNYNVAVGYEALRGGTDASLNTGNYNTALGYQTLLSTTSGINNTAVGYLAGQTSTAANAVTTGNNNTFIGYNTGFASATQRTNATAIGYNAKVDASNALVLGGTGADAVNVGIGTTKPSANLTIAKSGGFPTTQLRAYSSVTAIDAAVLQFNRARGTEGAPSPVLNNDFLGFIDFMSYNSTSFAGLAASIGVTASANHSATSSPAHLRFYTTASGSTFSLERMRIQSDGNIGIGETAPTNKLQVFSNTASIRYAGQFLNSATSGPGGIMGGVFGATDGANAVGTTKYGGLFQAAYGAGTNYGVWGEAIGGTGTNIAGYFNAVSGAANYAIIVPSGGGNVGIGTTTPVRPLDISYGNASGGVVETGLRVRNTSTTNSTQINLNGFRSWSMSVEGSTGAPVGGFTITDYTASVNRFCINNAGNVGIGTTSPTAKLHIGGTPGSDGIKFPDGTLQTTAAPGPRYLGELYGGGIIYYLYIGSDGLQHGLIVATVQSATGLKWQNAGVLVNADRTWDGVYNDALITDGPARDYCENLALGGFTDWYLPSIDELSLLWHNRFHANKALNDGGYTLLSTNGTYWSSTESNATLAYYFNCGNGSPNGNSKPTLYNVRAVRAF